VGIKPSCDALVVSRAGFTGGRISVLIWDKEYIRPCPPLALSTYEQQQVLDTLHDERFADKAPQEVYATLLDGGSYLCSVRTMYRILEAHKEVKKEGISCGIPYTPNLSCLQKDQTRSGPGILQSLEGRQVDLLLPLCHFSISSAGTSWAGWWHHGILGTLAKKLIEQSCEKQGIQSSQLSIHSDRGPSMTSKSVAFLLADLGINKKPFPALCEQ